MSEYTTDPYIDSPFTLTPYMDNPYGGDDIFEFTNDVQWPFTPSIEVTGTPEILWIWSDGTTDDKVIPDAVTVVGTHTLKVTPWSAVTRLNFYERHLIGSFQK